MSFAMSRPERERFLAEPRVAVVSIEDPGNGPLAVPVWFDYEPGGEIWFLTQSDSRKGRLLSQAGRFSLCVQVETPPYRYVSVEGPIVSMDPYDLEDDLRPMARRYLGAEGGDGYVEQARDTYAAGNGVKVRMRPARWLTVDYGKR